jgi:PAS domain S-box-containing protein
VSLRGSFQRVNRALSELLGWTEQELLTLSHDDIFYPGDRGAVDEARALLRGKSDALRVEQRLKRRDGSSVWVSLSASLMRNSSGEPVAFLAHFLDMSERHRAEAEARRAREAAEHANRAKSAFLARMSHELRTPLNAVLGFAQLLALDDLSADQRDGVERILRGGGHLVEVINDVLDISRVEAGELPIDPAPVPAAEVVEEVVSMLDPLANERGMSLVAETGEGLPYVRADRQRLWQVLVNLASNAIKYGPEGSRVLVRTAAAGERVRFAVVDEGPGIAPDDVERAFAPFERLPRHARVEGTGLGLALSRNLALAMGGAIGVEPHGAGSEFWVELDCAEAPPPAPAEPPRAPAVASRGGDGPHRILYVEDNPGNVDLMRRLVAPRADLELRVADLASARERAREQPDAILLDLNLSDGDGGDLLGELKRDPATASIPVIVVTADATRAREERVLEAGAAACVAKPIEVRALMQVLDAALVVTSGSA